MVIWAGIIILSIVISYEGNKRQNVLTPIIIACTIFILGVLLSAVLVYPIFDSNNFVKYDMSFDANIVMTQTVGILSPSYLATLFVPNLF